MTTASASLPVADEGLKNERGQAYVRFGICCFMAIYFYAIGFTNHWLYLWFAVYCLAYLAILRRARAFSTWRMVVALLLDNYFTIGGLHVTGERGVFLYIFLIHISFGYGVRYGRNYLWLSVTAACTGVITLYLSAPAWQGNVHSMIAYFFGVPFIALYIDYFVQRLRRAQLESEAHATATSKLLAFVAHDIRTPLQSLLTTIEVARGASQEADTRVRLGRIEQAVGLLARMTTEVLTTTRGATHPPPATQRTVVTYAWLIGVINIFRDDCMRQRIRLRYDFDFGIAPVIRIDRLAGERLLLNALSNAVRHAVDGEIKVTVTTAASGQTLLITIGNVGAADPPVPGAPLSQAAGSLHGAGLGLVAAQAIAEAAGGEFRFEERGAANHVAHISLPCSASAAPGELGVLLPVILIAPPVADLARLRTALAGLTRVLQFASLAAAGRHAAALRRDTAAVFVHATAITEAGPEATNALLPALGVYTLLDSTGAPCLPSGAPAFHVLDPAAAPAAFVNAVHVQAALRETDSSREPATRGRQLAGLRILLIEDNPANAAVLSETLGPAAARMTHAPTVDAARLELATTPFDVVLLDWNIGQQTGAELLEFFIETHGEAPPRLVVLSSESRALIASQLPDSLSCRILQRPVTMDALLETIAAAAGMRRSRPRDRAVDGFAIFDFELYEELRAGGSSIARLHELLEHFAAEVGTVFDRLQAVTGDGAYTRRALHSLKSIAEAAGAHELGRAAGALHDSLADAAGGAAGLDSSALDGLAALWHLTRRHVSVYGSYLAELDAVMPAEDTA